jgi:hypothetical protein
VGVVRGRAEPRVLSAASFRVSPFAIVVSIPVMDDDPEKD